MARPLLALILAALLLLAGWLVWSEWRRAGTTDVARPAAHVETADEVAAAQTATPESRARIEPHATAPSATSIAPPAPAAVQELDLGELAKAGPEPPPRTIEVRVLRGPQPLQTEVELSRFRSGIMTAAHLSGARDALDRRRTDERGIALFSGLEPGDYSLRAELEDGAALEAHTQLDDGPRGARVWLLFGDGGIRGRVYGDEGTPRAEVRIAVSAWRLPLRLEVATDWEGRYWVGGLRSGDYSVEEVPGNDAPEKEARSLHVKLAPGEWKTVDLGAPGGLVRWSGTLRLSDGQPASGPAQLELKELERGEASLVQVDENGRIAADVRAGRYAVRIWSLGDPLALGEVAIATGQGEVDLALPGAELAGLVRWGPDQLVPGENPAASYVQVWLKSVDRPERAGFATTDSAGRYVLRGLEPGNWSVSTHPGAISGAPLEGLVVRVLPGTAHLELDLELTAP
jgi:protocatechuate 3,4-dioxygenase beta subunit